MLKNMQIEKGVMRAPPGMPTRYPWHLLEIGDSIRFAKKNTANNHAKRAVERFAPKKFEAGLDLDGAPRVWRTE